MWWSEANKMVVALGKVLRILPWSIRLALARRPWHLVQGGQYNSIIFSFFNELIADGPEDIWVKRDGFQFGGGEKLTFNMWLNLRRYVGRKYFYGHEEYWFGRQLRKIIKQGDIYFDVGASVGFTSLIAAALGAEVYVFEPSPEAYRNLTRNVASNPKLKLKAFPWAASDKNDHSPFYLSEEMDGGNSLEKDYMARIRITVSRQIRIPVKRLDDLELPQPRVVKIDVEGHEMAVISGMGNCLAGAEYIFCETTPDRWEELQRRLAKLGFSQGYILDKVTGGYVAEVPRRKMRLFDTMFVKKNE